MLGSGTSWKVKVFRELQLLHFVESDCTLQTVKRIGKVIYFLCQWRLVAGMEEENPKNSRAKKNTYKGFACTKH